ncbi:ribosomal-protein-alanine N-acetyltransferase [Microbacterium resistens]|uniref:Ribosomal-protein-alanine N-acetyltransferase n=1 Tax=Microbacterium resistens TaxID=156977 RepID=A0ABU1SFY6_9MICO|nr:GNAT family protein [Microbacterium resistens]MDR6868515.1 ribosomal-protein-alanine N-acetyltransferase [Microbacterium resistens]
MDLGDGISLRRVGAGDGRLLAEAYTRNRIHLEPWNPATTEDFFTVAHQEAQVERAVREGEQGRSAAFVIVDDTRVLGRVNLSHIVRGVFCNADLGYWIDAEVAGRGIMRRAVALVRQHAQRELGLHRIQAATLVHNLGSQRVLAVNGFQQIGLAPRYLRIAGEWQDHLLFQRILEDPVAERPSPATVRSRISGPGRP